MPTTNIEGPNANIAAGTIDGVTYGALGQPQRIHESVTGASAAFGTTALKGSLYDNCFNANQIPSDATITGIELVAGVDFDDLVILTLVTLDQLELPNLQRLKCIFIMVQIILQH